MYQSFILSSEADPACHLAKHTCLPTVHMVSLKTFLPPFSVWARTGFPLGWPATVPSGFLHRHSENFCLHLFAEVEPIFPPLLIFFCLPSKFDGTHPPVVYQEMCVNGRYNFWGLMSHNVFIECHTWSITCSVLNWKYFSIMNLKPCSTFFLLLLPFSW